MKKLSILLVTALFSGMCFGQGIAAKREKNVKGTQKTFFRNTPLKKIINENSIKGDTILFENFEDGIPENWTTIDKDEDGFNWNYYYNDLSDLGYIVSHSYDNDSYTALTPDNWLITPQISIPSDGASILSYYVGAEDLNYYKEHYKIVVSTSTADITSFTTTIKEETLSTGEYEGKFISLSQFKGQNIYIAFVHCNVSDQFSIFLDDIEIFNTTEENAKIQIMNNVKYGCSTYFGNDTIQIKITNIGATQLENTDVSYILNDGTPVNESIAGSLEIGEDTIYSFTQTTDFSTANEYKIIVNAQISDSKTVSDSLIISSFSPISISTGGYSIDFNNLNNIDFLIIEDVNNDTYTWFLTDEDESTTSLGYYYNELNSANDWFFLPCMNFEAEEYNITFTYFAPLGDYYPEKLKIAYGQGVTAADMTNTITDITTEDSLKSTASNNFSISEAGVYNIGFQCHSDADNAYIFINNISIQKATSIKENTTAKISIYPNPANDIININGAENSRIDILNIVGDVVATVENADANQKINVGNFSKGMYFVRVNNSVYKINIAR